jgi:thiamine biosynthesis lipoprotein
MATPVGSGTYAAEWPVWSTTARLVVTDAGALGEARAIVDADLAAVDLAASRFRADSEVSRLHLAGGRPLRVSPLLAELVEVALAAARRTGGDVDPTLGAALAALGYDRDFGHVSQSSDRADDAQAPTGCGTTPGPRPHPPTAERHALALVTDRGRRLRVGVAPVAPTVAGWRRVRLDGRTLTVPPDVLLDLGATAKAHAADRCAARVAGTLGTGVLVSLGGDIATAGPAPDGGWKVLVRDRPGDPACTVAIPAGAAVATSSTASRRWRHGGRA